MVDQYISKKISTETHDEANGHTNRWLPGILERQLYVLISINIQLDEIVNHLTK